MNFPIRDEVKTWFVARGNEAPDSIDINDDSLALLEDHRNQAKRFKGWSDEQREDWALWVTYTHVGHTPATPLFKKPEPATLVDQIQNERIDNIEQQISVPLEMKQAEPEPYSVELCRPPDYTWVGWVALGALTAIQTFFIYGIWAHFGR